MNNTYTQKRRANRIGIGRSTWNIATMLSAVLLATAAAQAGPAADETKLDEIVVTGTTSQTRTIFDSSVAITVLSSEDLDRKAPRSTAEALQSIPGIVVEQSGGEISNNFTARGVPGGGQSFFQLAEDGLPVSYSGADTQQDMLVKPELALDRVEAVLGGTASTLTTNAAGAFINWITRKPTNEFAGTVRLTVSDYGTKRVDLWVGGPLSQDWRFSLSGFWRTSDGERPMGFTADHGGDMRFKLLRNIDQGEIGFDLKIVDDHNTFFLPTPMQNPGHPTGVPGFNALTGTSASPDNAVLTVRNGIHEGGFATIDNTDGSVARATVLGFHIDKELTPGITVHEKARYTDFSNIQNAIVNTGSTSLVTAVNRIDPAQNADIALLLSQFGPGTAGNATHVGYQVVPTGQVLSDPATLNALNGNGLVTTLIATNWSRAKTEIVNDLNVNWEIDHNTLTVGLLTFNGHRVEYANGGRGTATFISEVKSKPNRLDIVALDANNNPVGYLTDHGLLNFDAFGQDGPATTQFDSNSFYLNDEFKATERLRLDGGARVETLKVFTAWPNQGAAEAVPGMLNPALVSPANPLGMTPGNIRIADNYIGQFGGGPWDGTFSNFNYHKTKAAWTLGGNYKFSDSLSVYARHAYGFEQDLPSAGSTSTPQLIPQGIRFSEVGTRFRFGSVTASATAFATHYSDFIYSTQGSGIGTQAYFLDYDTHGVEFNLNWQPLEYFQIQFTGLGQKSKLKEPASTLAANPGSPDYSGNVAARLPEVVFTVTPRLLLPHQWGEVYANVFHNGARWSDIANTQGLPAYTTLAMGVTLNPVQHLRLNLTGENLLNTVGLTEGSSRAGLVEGGTQIFYARSIVGRNVVLSATYDF